MATTDLITQLKQDFDDVYEAGKAAGGGSGDYDQGYEDGKNSVVRLERYSKQIQLTSLNIFGKSEVVLNLDNATSLNALCSITGQNNPNRNNTVEHLTINCPNLIEIIQMMLYCDNYNIDNTLRHITFNVDTQKASRFLYAFRGLNALQIIDGQPLNLTSGADINMFGVNSALEEVRFVANSIKLSISLSSSPLLSTETIQSIIDGLADLTGGTAQTLTLHATVGSKLTDEQKATITAKNWELVY